MIRESSLFVTVFTDEEKVISVKEGDNLFKALIKNGFNIPNACGGGKTCGKCKGIVSFLSTTEISEEEKRYLSKEEIENGVRLLCFINVYEDIKVILGKVEERAKIMVEGLDEDYNLNSNIWKWAGELPKGTLKDQKDDLTRIYNCLGLKRGKVSFNLLKKIPDLLNEDYSEIIIRDDEILDITPKGKGSIYGIAVDIGTTTIALYLIDMEKGKVVDTISQLNSQKVYGADVIARINYTIENSTGLEEVNKTIVSQINKMIKEVCDKNNIETINIYEGVFVGNTTMIHMFYGVDCKNIAVSPYIPVFTESLSIKGNQMGIDINVEGYITSLPCIASYVGADTMSAIIACNMQHSEEISLLIDIGTNGEIVLGNNEKLISCSAAAGPAFEGAKMSCGVGGILGAIDHIKIDQKVEFTTIGNKNPIGLCGSGILDAISELYKSGFIDETGRMEGEEKYNITEDIYISQKDIRELQLAKGAIYAGIKVLVKEMGISINDIKKLYLAGGFGNYIDINSALLLKMIPEELEGKSIAIGNAAGTGAKMYLLSNEYIKEVDEIKKRIEYIELSCSPLFQDEFIEGMGFKE